MCVCSVVSILIDIISFFVANSTVRRFTCFALFPFVCSFIIPVSVENRLAPRVMYLVVRTFCYTETDIFCCENETQSKFIAFNWQALYFALRFVPIFDRYWVRASRDATIMAELPLFDSFGEEIEEKSLMCQCQSSDNAIKFGEKLSDEQHIFFVW